jgi:hypothetical protein
MLTSLHCRIEEIEFVIVMIILEEQDIMTKIFRPIGDREINKEKLICGEGYILPGWLSRKC